MDKLEFSHRHDKLGFGLETSLPQVQSPNSKFLLELWQFIRLLGYAGKGSMIQCIHHRIGPPTYIFKTKPFVALWATAINAVLVFGILQFGALSTQLLNGPLWVDRLQQWQDCYESAGSAKYLCTFLRSFESLFMVTATVEFILDLLGSNSVVDWLNGWTELYDVVEFEFGETKRSTSNFKRIFVHVLVLAIITVAIVQVAFFQRVTKNKNFPTITNSYSKFFNSRQTCPRLWQSRNTGWMS